MLADRYFRVTTEAIHAQDPHHLILGVKQISQLTPPAVLEAARPYVDVFSVDDYTLTPGLADQIQQAWPMYLPHDPTLSAIARIVRRPLMVMEYSFRAADAGVPNSYPPIFPTLPTQQARADAFADVRPNASTRRRGSSATNGSSTSTNPRVGASTAKTATSGSSASATFHGRRSSTA